MINRSLSKRNALNVRAQIDRVQLVSWAPEGRKPPTLTGFALVRDSFVRCQTTAATYARCRQYESVTDDTKIYWQYNRQKAWLQPWKITIVADDRTGLSSEEIKRVLRRCRSYRFLTIEIAVDFDPSAGVTQRFIHQHAIFGKGRRRARKIARSSLYFGGRKSGKFIRCYEKKGLQVFRVELELHARLLRRYSIFTLDDLRVLPDAIYPKHLQFVEFDWVKLEKHLTARFGTQASRVLAGARKREASLQRVRRYLARQGVVNTHRFLVPLAINEDIVDALNRWARTFRKESNA